ncbi:uncharacterized protein LOC124885849 [Capsicum annuum]|uniref:uncharacterized protein LOC124885849 n=1 Tax=Capsicum annuum TaxID=4072 RepID=UPI001FB0A2E4|nr:uncharacterized protein LOC124885849 [Capsicum annuum]
MENMGFSNRLRWIMECVKTIKCSIIVNGEPTPPIDAAKGLKQGDPMSLFLLAMEYLSSGLNILTETYVARSLQKWQRVHVGFSKSSVFLENPTWLLLSNKSLIGSLHPLDYKKTCTKVLRSFFLFLGGRGSFAVRNQSLAQHEFTHGEMPFRYLGVPLPTEKMSLMQWQPLID